MWCVIPVSPLIASARSVALSLERYLLDLALADGMSEGEPPRRPEVKAGLDRPNIEWSPDSAAPAMPIPRFEQHELCLAA